MLRPTTPGRSRRPPVTVRRTARHPSSHRGRWRPRLEALEDRRTPSVLVVSTTADVVDPNDGALSLREAVTQANLDPPGDTIRLPAGVYNLGPGPGTAPGATAPAVELDVTNSMNFVGDGPAATAIDAQFGGRVLAISFDASGVGTVGFTGLTIRHGSVGFFTADGSGGQGGGIYASSGVVRLVDCAVSDNRAAQGGGLWVGNVAGRPGSLELIDTTVSGNLATGAGGGIWASGMDAALVGSALSGNFAGEGGGLFTAASPGGTRVRLTNSTVSGNGGGPLLGPGPVVGPPPVNLSHGGGLRIAAGDTLVLIHATVTANSAFAGGGISNSGTAYLTNTIVAGNTLASPAPGGPTPSGPDLDGAFVGADHNLIGDASSSTGLVDGQGGDQVGPVSGQPIDPKLGPLRDNGGPTFTHALLDGSPATDAARDGLAPTDQRRAPRPQGARADVGAFEGPLGPVTPLPATATERDGIALPGDGDNRPPDSRPQAVLLGQFYYGGGTEPGENFQVHINWGDGTVIPGGVLGPGYFNGQVVLTSGTYTVWGSQAFLDEAVRTVSADVYHSGAYQFSFSTTLTVLEELLPDGSRGTPNQRFVSELYRDLLQRKADGPGLAAWSALLDQGVSRAQVAFLMMTDSGNEYRRLVVQGVYHSYLGRDVDPDGLAAWVQFLAAGGTPEQMAAAVAGSPEFYQLAGGTDDGFLDRLYFYALGRAPDADGRAAFSQALAAGLSRTDAAATVLGSEEYRARQAGLRYYAYLDRAPEPGGAEAWAAALGTGLSDEAVLAAFLGEPSVAEFFNKTAG
jgi:hypothetical protein